jgi:hypothetical protein
MRGPADAERQQHLGRSGPLQALLDQRPGLRILERPGVQPGEDPFGRGPQQQPVQGLAGVPSRQL